MERKKIAVISSGNGGQSLAAWFAYKGADVAMYAREQERVDMFESNDFTIKGVLEATAHVELISCDMKRVLANAELIMVTTPSHYYKIIGAAMAPYLASGQVVVLNPGRTFGTYEFTNVLHEYGCFADVTVAEMDTFIFTCRAEKPGTAEIYCIKDNVRVASHIRERGQRVLALLKDYFDTVSLADSVFETGFSNIGMVFHPAPVLMNFSKIENKERFLYYHGAITPRTADMLSQIDAERVAVAAEAGFEVMPVLDWLADRYGSAGDTLYDRIQNTEAYNDIYAPETVDTRYVLEDVRTGCVPISCVAEELGVPTPAIDSVIAWASSVYGVDFYATGRNEYVLDINKLMNDLRKYVASKER